ncbi:hypothetical protein Bbelb_188690 [Branchiostoma belcheri]|nr:hypothetical protein Bbelb_188690 [Branchiostoma belcheri]
MLSLQETTVSRRYRQEKNPFRDVSVSQSAITDLAVDKPFRSSVTYVFGLKVGKGRKPQDPPKLVCRDGYSLYNNMCYKAFTKPLTWHGAYIKCLTAECGNLAMPRTEDIDKFLISLKNTTDPKSNFWFGLKRNPTKREQFHWVVNAADILDRNTSYTNWAPGQPDDDFGDEDCVLYVGRDSEFPDTWHDSSCFSSLPYLCSTKPKLANRPFCKA